MFYRHCQPPNNFTAPLPNSKVTPCFDVFVSGHLYSWVCFPSTARLAEANNGVVCARKLSLSLNWCRIHKKSIMRFQQQKSGKWHLAIAATKIEVCYCSNDLNYFLFIEWNLHKKYLSQQLDYNKKFQPRIINIPTVKKIC